MDKSNGNSNHLAEITVLLKKQKIKIFIPITLVNSNDSNNYLKEVEQVKNRVNLKFAILNSNRSESILTAPIQIIDPFIYPDTINRDLKSQGLKAIQHQIAKADHLVSIGNFAWGTSYRWVTDSDGSEDYYYFHPKNSKAGIRLGPVASMILHPYEIQESKVRWVRLP